MDININPSPLCQIELLIFYKYLVTVYLFSLYLGDILLKIDSASDSIEQHHLSYGNRYELLISIIRYEFLNLIY